jgi:hypothetical protein
LLLLPWPLAVKKKKHLHLHQLLLLLRHLLQLHLLLKLLLLLLHLPWLKLLLLLLTLSALPLTRQLTLLLKLPKLLLPSNQLFVDSKKPPSGGFFTSVHFSRLPRARPVRFIYWCLCFRQVVEKSSRHNHACFLTKKS